MFVNKYLRYNNSLLSASHLKKCLALVKQVRARIWRPIPSAYKKRFAMWAVNFSTDHLETGRYQVFLIGKRYIIPNIQYDTPSNSIPILCNEIVARNTYLIVGYYFTNFRLINSKGELNKTYLISSICLSRLLTYRLGISKRFR